MSENYFMGLDGFVWFTGVVEDRNDPDKLGRVRVRCLGFHTDDLSDIPTASLPWAHVMHPVTDPSMQGLGNSPSFLVEGSWVIGFFRDAVEKQQPIIIGSLPGIPKSAPDYSKGFNDPRSPFSSQAPYAGTPTYGPYPVDGFDYEMPSGHDLGEPDTNRLAVNNEDNPHLGLELRKATRITGLATADFDADTAADASTITASDTDNWDQPEIAYASIYPNNHVYESESGHILEFDDTSAAERIHLTHKTGTSLEYNPNGDRVQIIKGIDYKLTSSHNLVNIEGRSDISIGGRHKIYINKDGAENNNYDIQIGPNANINIQVDKGNINVVTVDGNINVNSAGNYNVNVGGNYTMAVKGNRQIDVEGTTTDNTTGAVIHRGNPIDLNP